MLSFSLGHRLPSTRAACAPALALAASCSSVFAAERALEPVVVTATRQAQPLSQVLADVSVVTREEIERQGGGAVADVLRTLPAFELARNGGPGNTTSVFVRGAESRHMLVLIDGVRVDTQSASGGATWEALPLAFIDRIEVIRGPASAIYGSDAVAGVVQIFTRSGQGSPRLDVGVGIGDPRMTKVDGSVLGSYGAVDYAVSIAAERSKGFDVRKNSVRGTPGADTDGYNSTRGNVRLGYKVSPDQQLQFTANSHKVNAQYDAFVPSFGDRSIHDLDTFGLSWKARWFRHWTSTVSAGQSEDRYDDHSAYPYQTRTRLDTAVWLNQVDFGPNTLRATIETRRDRLVNSGLLQSPTPGEGARTDDALGLGYDLRVGTFALQTSVRRDDDSEFGQHDTGAVAAAVDLGPWNLRASSGTAYRAPTLYQRFSAYGNQRLTPEESRTDEVGLRFKQGSTRLGVTWYDSRYDNLLIFGDPGICADAYNCYRNVAKARSKGVSLEGAFALGPVRLNASWDFVDPRDEASGKVLRRRARQHGFVRGEWDVQDWNLGLQVLSSGKRYDDAANKVALDAYKVWSLDAQRRLSSTVRLLARVDNVTDEQYETARHYASQPRTVFLGLRWTPSL